MTDQTTASVLFQTAYEGRYTWDTNFPGYSANVQLVQGTDVYTGKISINRDLSVEVVGIANEEVQEGIYIQLQDVVIHRQHSSFEESYGKCEFTLGETDETGAVEIIVKSDSGDSHYKIRGGEIYQVSRAIARNAFVIDTHENFHTGAGYIALRYDAVFRNAKTDEVTSVLKFEDTYEKFGDYYLLTKQVVHEFQDGDRSTTEFSYSNIKLLGDGE
ncbi:DUF3386 domain-containing protein [Calothrix sp. PCC 7507]|uniref:DUF3386 domain-containing protein n=1 Tax=Calothrix sp. PCC 7507 TaxID=99598 RepID=UPI00029EE0DF|nr:DUF3386 domain-containing protein [Calothrix sp. PCC 7507]AFY35304.1 hypothetical protein Cal7507_4953 [Calothrix sp. PCC 7507]